MTKLHNLFLEYLIYLYIIAAIFSCSNKQKKEIPSVVDVKKGNTSQPIIDTTFTCCSGKADGIEFKVVCVDTSFYFEQKINNNWVISDLTTSYAMDSNTITVTDLNNDGYDDIIIRDYLTPSGCNSQNVVFLYYPKDKQFKHNHFYDLPNICYDRKHNIISSIWRSGNYLYGETKYAFKITCDSLEFMDELDFIPQVMFGKDGLAKYPGKRDTINYYVGGCKSDELKFVKTLTGNVWDRFDTALFDSRKFFEE